MPFITRQATEKRRLKRTPRQVLEEYLFLIDSLFASGSLRLRQELLLDLKSVIASYNGADANRTRRQKHEDSENYNEAAMVCRVTEDFDGE